VSSPHLPQSTVMLHASGLIYIAHLAHLSCPKGHRVLHYLSQPPTLVIYLLSTTSPFSRDIPETRVALHLAVDCPHTWLASYLSYLAALVHLRSISSFGSSHPPGQTDIFASLLASPHNLRHPTFGYLTTTLHIFL
jgi:hypothetical protein